MYGVTYNQYLAGASCVDLTCYDEEEYEESEYRSSYSDRSEVANQTAALLKEVLQRLNQSPRNIVIYEGQGADASSVSSLHKLFNSFGLDRWTITPFKQGDNLLQFTLLNEIKEMIFVLPGGMAQGYEIRLGRDVNILRECYQKGLSFLMICAGFYWTSAVSIYPQNSEAKTRALNLFQGISIGPRIPKIIDRAERILPTNPVDWQGRLRDVEVLALDINRLVQQPHVIRRSILAPSLDTRRATDICENLFEHRIVPVELEYRDQVIPGHLFNSGGGTFVPYTEQANLYKTILGYTTHNLSLDKKDMAVVAKLPESPNHGRCVGSSCHFEYMPEDVERVIHETGLEEYTPTTVKDLQLRRKEDGGLKKMRSFSELTAAITLEHLVGADN
ncbi:MAG: hypothetical protein FJZ56_04190 [Chlamydiae bacterium]|nr:hypothetical protein [Chlamydiota bacterium]